jgi:cytochrome b561
MVLLRYLLATLALLIVWPAVALAINLLIAFVFQPREAAFFMFVFLDWHAIPGLVIGLLLGLRWFRYLSQPRENHPPTQP